MANDMASRFPKMAKKGRVTAKTKGKPRQQKPKRLGDRVASAAGHRRVDGGSWSPQNEKAWGQATARQAAGSALQRVGKSTGQPKLSKQGSTMEARGHRQEAKMRVSLNSNTRARANLNQGVRRAPRRRK